MYKRPFKGHEQRVKCNSDLNEEQVRRLETLSWCQGVIPSAAEPPLEGVAATYPTQNAELRKARRSWYNQFMRLNKIIQRDYTSFSLYYQIKLPLDLEISIPSDDPVRLVSAFVEEMDLSELYKTYGRIRKNQATPRQMLKLVIYAAMNRIYSSQRYPKRHVNGLLRKIRPGYTQN